MNSVFVVTTGNEVSRAHISDSFVSGIARSLASDIFPWPLLDDIQRLAGGLYVWGTSEGKRNISNWEALQPGDFVLCSYDRTYQYVARVVHKEHNPKAAQTIWANDKAGKSWDYLYFLTEPKPVTPAVTVEALRSYLNANHVGFSAIGKGKLQAIYDEFGSLEEFFARFLGFDAFQDTSHDYQSEITGREVQEQGVFDPTDTLDARKKTISAIVCRRGQKLFWKSLMQAYSGRCAITGCDCVDVLEAAHIVGFKDERTNHVTNGLLLRGDIHTLLDLGLITINSNYTVVLDASLMEGSYRCLAGRKLALPEDPQLYPDTMALALARANENRIKAKTADIISHR